MRTGVNAALLNPRKARHSRTQGSCLLLAADSSIESHLFWVRNCRKSHWTMKGHRRKKISVGPESLRGQGLALGGGICCQEERVRHQPRPQLRLGPP